MRWQMGDPALVYERKEAQANNQMQREIDRARKSSKQQIAKKALESLFMGNYMTQDEIDQVENLLLTWHDYENAYRLALGAPRVSPSCRGYDAGEIHEDGYDRDAKLNKIKAEAVDACIDTLKLIYRVAITTHLRNKRAKMAIFRHPMLGTPEQAHQWYLDAAALLWPLLKNKELVR